MAVMILGIIFGFSLAVIALVFFTDYRKRLLRHKEHIAAIEKGLLPGTLKEDDVEAERWHSGRGRYHGMTTLFVGFGLAMALYVTSGPKTAVWGAFVAVIGMGQLLQSYLSNRAVSGGEG